MASASNASVAPRWPGTGQAAIAETGKRGYDADSDPVSPGRHGVKDAPIACGENRLGHSEFHCRRKGRNHLSKDQARLQRKQHLDALLLALPGVSGKTINGLDAYFVTDRMFACISGTGVGLRLPIAKATELQFSRDNVVPFQPGGMASTREWVQIDRADATDYKNDLELFQASMEFVRGGTSR